MKRHFYLTILIAALSAPAAFAGADIVKCVDDAGHVTLTDQPCESGAAVVRLASAPAEETVSRTEPAALAVEQAVLPPPPVARRFMAPRVKTKPLMHDVATLKAARAQFLLSDVRGKQTLAKLD